MRNHLTKITVAFILMSLLNAITANAFEKGAAIRQNVLVMKRPRGLEQLYTDKSFGISETRTRFWLGKHFGNVKMNAAVEIRGNFTSLNTAQSGMFGSEGSLLGSGKPLQRWDWTADHLSGNSTTLSTRIEMLDVTWSAGKYDFLVGRQPVSLGTSHFIGVLDVVAPFAPGDLDATYKPGVDAVRVRRMIGMTGEAEIIAVGERDISDGALLVRLRTAVKSVDVEIVGGRSRRRSFGGLGWEGGVASVGVWGEMALFERRGEPIRGGLSKAAFTGVTGVDISVLDNTIIGGAFMYQDFGVHDPEDLASVYTDAPFAEGWMFLGGASYGVVTVHRQLHPLVDGDAAGIINLMDGSTLWQPRVTISTGDNTDLSVYAWIGTGEKSEVNGNTVRIWSEFGTLPVGGGLYARWFF